MNYNCGECNAMALKLLNQPCLVPFAHNPTDVNFTLCYVDAIHLSLCTFYKGCTRLVKAHTLDLSLGSANRILCELGQGYSFHTRRIKLIIKL